MDLDAEIDEGFEKEMADEVILLNEDQDPIDLPPPAESSESDDNKRYNVQYYYVFKNESLFSHKDHVLHVNNIICYSTSLQIKERVDGDEGALDFRGVPGWDRVDHLAKGLCVTNTQAREIKERLLPYDKKPLSFDPRPLKPARGKVEAHVLPTHRPTISRDSMKTSCLLTKSQWCSNPYHQSHCIAQSKKSGHVSAMYEEVK